MSLNEFSLIDRFFKSGLVERTDVVFGIGDDAACLEIPSNSQLLVSTDTLVAEVHFLSSWDPYDIAWKAVMVNVSDMAAMAATPCWMSLALTMPAANESWLERFSEGLKAALAKYNIALIGGDTTRGPLSLSLTIHGTVSRGKAVRRCNARPGDVIWVSGDLGAAALAVDYLQDDSIPIEDKMILMEKLLRPVPRTDLRDCLQQWASACIDISDGLSADLNHICEESQVGACLSLSKIPAHPLIGKYRQDATESALSGGDDYELCFTIPARNQQAFMDEINRCKIICHPIGVIEEEKGLRSLQETGRVSPLRPKGFAHF
ncbi:thiamine monophosphate kinase (AIR synthase) [Legionella birminghamensis]|uniref:Thiamine-monophosphate kinase n=1 Tax=Legionella birminghamensis TaxID=28083 RepID=A0A378I753_9GAMM|nr:thiamine-phosphate kinase [Legionella birminghamensis]KTC68241.1 thiamine monophosphate kinase (AIR synthase) [Legionella birminghamensis]STX31048.1 thiamine monophosphate kinase (AIR synthase) [Legionella birminghamensis]